MVTIPGPQENDADDVSLALEVAQSQWTRGDRGEALKWLKKAVDAAFEADDDKRGMELSKIAAEVKAEIEKPVKPKMPPPRGAPPARPSAPPARPSAPGARPSAPPARPSAPGARASAVPPAKPSVPPPLRKPEPKASPSDLDVTGTRPASRRSSKPHKLEEDEATREYQLADVDAIADEWPTETLENVDDLLEAPEQTESRSVGKSRSKSGSRSLKVKSSKPDPEPEQPKPVVKSKRHEPVVTVPSTRAIRVAVGRDKGAVYVRALDSQGLREGEHDAMLVALTSDGDIRGLFR